MRIAGIRIGLILAGALLGLFATQHLVPAQPRKYRSTVTLQIKVASASSFSSEDPAFVADLEKEFQRLRTSEILSPVVDALGLPEKWSHPSPLTRDLALEKLRQEMTLSPIRNTQLAQISVTDPDPQLAAKLANGIAMEYQKRRTASEPDPPTLHLKQLQDEVSSQEKKTELLKQQAEQIRAQQGESSEAYKKAQEAYDQARQSLEKAEMLLQTETSQTMMPAKPVTIWEKAEPAEYPVWAIPQVVRLAAGALLGALLGGLLSLLIRK